MTIFAARSRTLALAALVLCVALDRGPIARACEDGSAAAGFVSRALVQRPIGITGEAGSLHQKVTTSSTEAQAYYDQGFAYLASYVWVEAARSFHEALRRDADLAMAHLGLFKAYAALGARDDARLHLERAEQLAGAGKASPIEARWIEVGRRQWQAIEAPAEERGGLAEVYKRAADELVALDPTDANAWVLRGNAEEGPWGRGQFGGVETIAYYETALRWSPEHLGAHHYLTHSYENIGQHQLAAEHGRRYAAAAPQVPHAQHMYGHVLPRLGRWKEALEQFEKADRLHREHARREGIPLEDDWHYGHNLHLLATMHLRLGHEKEAARLFREEFDLHMRGHFGGVYSASWVEYLLLRERFDDALEAARAVEKRPSPAAKMIGAALGGEALLGRGRVPEARQAHTRAAAARDEFIAAMRGSPLELGAPAFADHFVDTLAAELALRGNDPAAGEKQMLALADRLAGSPRFDAWAFGLFWLERLAHDARRAGREELAQELRQRMQRIDPQYHGRETAE